MTVKEELEVLAKDCEACALDARERMKDTRDRAEEKAWLSVASRIRRAVERIGE